MRGENLEEKLDKAFTSYEFGTRLKAAASGQKTPYRSSPVQSYAANYKTITAKTTRQRIQRSELILWFYAGLTALFYSGPPEYLKDCAVILLNDHIYGPQSHGF
jgi:hypothetical protein